jgi:hypothetical protein
MKAYSPDLCAKIAQACDEGAASGRQLARHFRYGRTPPGERVLGSAPQNYGQNVTILGALSSIGLEAVMTVEGATDSDVFHAYVREVWCPTLREGDIVIADNLSAHKAAGVQAAIAARHGCASCHRTRPTCIRSSGAGPRSRRSYVPPRRARAALDAAVTRALATVTESDARVWFAHSGYVLH